MIQLASYNGTGKWATWTDKLILIRSKPYTHSELVFSDGLSFSSSGRKGKDGKPEGVRFKTIDYTKHRERWHLDPLMISMETERKIRLHAEVINGMGLKYDFRGIVGFVLTGHQNAKDWFCSELCYALLATEFFLSRMNFKMHPTELQKWVEILGRELRISGTIF